VTIRLGYERHDTEFLAETARLVEVTTGSIRPPPSHGVQSGRSTTRWPTTVFWP